MKKKDNTLDCEQKESESGILFHASTKRDYLKSLSIPPEEFLLPKYEIESIKDQSGNYTVSIIGYDENNKKRGTAFKVTPGMQYPTVVSMISNGFRALFNLECHKVLKKND